MGEDASTDQGLKIASLLEQIEELDAAIQTKDPDAIGGAITKYDIVAGRGPINQIAALRDKQANAKEQVNALLQGKSIANDGKTSSRAESRGARGGSPTVVLNSIPPALARAPEKVVRESEKMLLNTGVPHKAESVREWDGEKWKNADFRNAKKWKNAGYTSDGVPLVPGRIFKLETGALFVHPDPLGDVSATEYAYAYHSQKVLTKESRGLLETMKQRDEKKGIITESQPPTADTREGAGKAGDKPSNPIRARGGAPIR